jgi:hypothetical protein
VLVLLVVAVFFGMFCEPTFAVIVGVFVISVVVVIEVVAVIVLLLLLVVAVSCG